MARASLAEREKQKVRREKQKAEQKAAERESQKAEEERQWQRRKLLLPTPVAAERLGLTASQFRKLATDLALKPESWYRNPNHLTGPECPLWPPEPIAALVAGPEVTAVLERSRRAKEARALKPEKRRAEFRERYGDWRTALRDAAEAMFSLNRYAKHASCRPEHRDEIYSLKSGLLHLLCEEGMVVEVKHHDQHQAGKSCRACNPDGVEDDGSAGHSSCRRCAGTGWYLPPRIVRYVAFRFVVDGRRFAWHQPSIEVGWEYPQPTESSEWTPEPGGKPTPMPRRRFAEAKDLVGWVIGESRRARSNPPS
ncbi:MAG: hypothetical protein IT379_39665 [Deltaproteobacteria bacterium]|nr:hypothetical protein [Deltaproteobacteria bacterium]